MLHRRPLLPAFAFILLAAATPPAHATAHDDCADAGEHLRIARRALTVRDFPTAIAHFKASYELDGQPLTLIFLARAYAADGDLFSAIELYRSYLEVEPTSQRTFDVEGEIARLSKRLLSARIAIFDDN